MKLGSVAHDLLVEKIDKQRRLAEVLDHVPDGTMHAICAELIEALMIIAEHQR